VGHPNQQIKLERRALPFSFFGGLRVRVAAVMSGCRLDAELIAAVRSGHVSEVASLLEAGASANARDDQGRTILGWGCYHGRFECVQLLLQCRADVDNANTSGNTALLICADSGHPDCLQLLIGASAAINRTDTNGAPEHVWRCMRIGSTLLHFLWCRLHSTDRR